MKISTILDLWNRLDDLVENHKDLYNDIMAEIHSKLVVLDDLIELYRKSLDCKMNKIDDKKYVDGILSYLGKMLI